MPLLGAGDGRSNPCYFFLVLPGIPVEADETLNLRTMGAALKAAEDAQAKFEALGQRLVSVRIWQGKLIAMGSERLAYVYFLPCKKCLKKRREKAPSV